MRGIFNVGMENSESIDLGNTKSIDNVLTYISLCERGFNCPDPSFFDGAVVGWRSVFNYVANIFEQGKYRGDVSECAKDLDKIAGSMIMAPDDQESVHLISACRQMDYQSKQKLIMVTGGHDDKGESSFTAFDKIFEVRCIEILKSGIAKSVCRNYLFRSRDAWRPVYPFHPFRMDPSYDHERTAFGTGVAVAFSMRNAWAIRFRYSPAMPSISLLTDPTGVKEFLKFREVDDGKSRRDALIHWVSDHWRQDRHDPECEIYVRRHLRGREECRWHGIEAKVMIPEVVLTEVDSAKANRKRLSKDGLAQRIKLVHRRA